MDLTEGVIWKKLILYAGPVVLSSLLQSAYSITDLIVAGWFIGKDGISAINNASQVMMILTQTLYLIFDYPYKYYTFKLFEV